VWTCLVVSNVGHILSHFACAELLSLGNNTLTGTIPNDAFVGWNVLDTLDLVDNRLGGSIPSSLFAIPTLRLVYLSNNALTGTIPSNVGDGPLLRDLYLMHNQLTGSIPSIIGDSWRNLTELLLQDNELTGTMPDLICRLRSEAILEDLWADCAGNEPEVECSCCSQCIFV
jgi:hypothetical protein